MQKFTFNSSNKNKITEFKKIFDEHGINIQISNIDINEIFSDPYTVITHKASQLPNYTLVADTSLDVEGASIGVNIKWVTNLNDYIGRRARWRVLVAYRYGVTVNIYSGHIDGKIVKSINGGFGFDPMFVPHGGTKTLYEEKPDKFNATLIAMNNFFNGNPYISSPIITEWDGLWQN
jgi:inosine/xanthosine triphosphate pyrophosphatase family protein